jgi:cytidine deaminase
MTDVTRLASRRLPKMVSQASRATYFAKAKVTAEVWEDGVRLSYGKNGEETYEADEDNSERVGHCAEEEAILRAFFSGTRPNNAVLLVARAKKRSRSGPWVQGLAKPCDRCRKLMKRYGVGVVAYTDDHESHVIEVDKS